MQNPRILGILFLLLALGGVGAWFLLSNDSAIDLPVGTKAGPEAAVASRADAASATVASGAEEAATRVVAQATEGVSGAAADASVHGLFGQVVDDVGAPVAGALVRCSVGWGGADFENFDPADFEDFDPQVMAERWKAQQRERTEAMTDAEGRFRLAAAAGTARNVSLQVLARSHVVLDKNVPRPVGADSDLGVLTLKRGVVLSGRVVDRSGSPVAAARVERQDPPRGRGGFDFDFDFPGAADFEDPAGEQVAKTDADGRFELTHCEPGDFVLRARHPDHPSSTLENLTAQPGAVLEGVLIVVEPGAVISGRILGVPDGQKPLRVMASLRRDDTKGNDGGAGGFMSMMGGDLGEFAADAGFNFGEKAVDTGADFTFAMRGLQVGKSYRIWAVQNGRGFAGNALCTQRLEATSGTTGVELRYDTGITVTFLAIDAKTGAPIERMWVKDQLRGGGGGMEDMMSFMPRGSRSKAYPEGRVAISNLRPKKKQSLQLQVDAVGYGAFERKDIALPTSGTLDLGVIKLDPAPVLEVLVRSGVDQHAVAGATVGLESLPAKGAQDDNPFTQFASMGGGGSGPRMGKTDAEGRCVLNATAGSAKVTVKTKEFAPYASDPIDLPAGTSGKHEVVLVRGGGVAVTAISSDGQPLGEGSVEHRTPSGERDARDLDKQGHVAFERLLPGEHRFRLGKPGGNGMDFGMVQARLGRGQGEQVKDDPDWQVVMVEDGGKTTIELRKAAMASLRGIVRENGVPLAGARISFVEGAEGDQDAGGIEGRLADMMSGMGDQGRGGRTGKDGSYQLADMPAGLHRLRVTSRERVMPATVSVTLRLGENVFDVDLDAILLRGTVKDQAGSPVAGATVSVVPVKPMADAGNEQNRMIEEVMGGMDFGGMVGDRGQAKTDAEGNYELRGVLAGKSVQVRASAKGYAAAMSAVVEIPQAGTLPGVDITLGAAGRVKIEVADAPQFAQVRAVNVTADGVLVAGISPVTQMMRRGKATLDGLIPGRWKVTVNVPNGTPRDPRFVEVAAGETATLNF